MKISARWVKKSDSLETLMWGHLEVGHIVMWGHLTGKGAKTWYAYYRYDIHSIRSLKDFATAYEAKRAVDAALARLLVELASEDPGVSLKEFNELDRIAKFGPQKVMDDYDY